MISVYVSRNSGNADCYTGWANQDYMEVWEPTPDEQSMISYIQRMNTDTGVDETSSLLSTTFTKKTERSSLRLLYYDNLRVIGHGDWCRWEIKIDGQACPVPVGGSIYTYRSDNDHYPHTIIGECPGFKKGAHKIDISLTRNSGADCYTGWSPGPKVQHALIEVQETCGAIPGCAVMASCEMESEQCKQCRPGYKLYHGKVDSCKMPPGEA